MESNAKKFLAVFLCICMLMSGTAYAQESGVAQVDSQTPSALEEQGTDSSAEGEKTESEESENTEAVGDAETNETNLENQEAESNAAEAQAEGTAQNNAAIADGVEINEANFSDANFRKYVSNFDKDSNGTLSEGERNAVTEIQVSSKGISDLKGVEYFTSLTKLNCSYNKLTGLDVSKNVNLISLDCMSNQLAALDVSGATNLGYLKCRFNQLTSLDISRNMNLEELDCTVNQLSNLNVGRAVNLDQIYCSNNQLTNLDVSGAVNLTELLCDNNQLASLDISKNVNLERLECERNQLTSLDASKNVNLSTLYCSCNRLTDLDVDGAVRLKYLDCSDNLLTDLSVGRALKLNTIWCDNNQLTDLDISEAVNLLQIHCNNNQLTDLDVSKNVGWLSTIWCDNNQLTSLDVSKNVSLDILRCANNQLTSLDVSKNVNLYRLDCKSNQLMSLDVENCTKLYELDIRPLAKSDVKYTTEPTVFLYGSDSSAGVEISELNFPDANFCNYVKQFDMNGNGVLSESEIRAVTRIFVGKKNISDLAGIEHFTSLTELDCSDNKLKALNVSQNVNLTRLDCHGNQLIALDVRNCEKLYYLDVRPLAKTDVKYTTGLTADDRYAIDPGVFLYGPESIDGIEINGTNFPDANFRNYVKKFDTDGDGMLSENEIRAVTKISVRKKKISELTGIEHFTSLTELDCSDNKLTSLDTSKNVNLTYLDCSSNKLKALDVSQNQVLASLICDDNKLTGLDMSQNVDLTELNCSHNKLRSLDVRNCTRLDYLDVRPLPKSAVKYKNRPATFLYGSDNPGHWNPYIDIFTKTDPAKIKPETSGIDLESIYKIFGIDNAADLEVIVEQKDAGFLHQKRLTDHAAKFGDKILKIYDVVMNLYKDGRYNTAITDNFGKLTLSFYAGKEYAGKTVVIYQLHGTSEVIPYRDLTVDENGMVTITVSKLSTFAVALQNADGSAADANASPQTSDSANMTVWVALMMLTMTIIPIVTILGRRQKR